MKEKDFICKARTESLDETGMQKKKAARSFLEKVATAVVIISIFSAVIAHMIRLITRSFF